MNRYRQILWGIGLLLLVVLLGGCAKQPINSDVEGFWQLKRFTTLADGETHEPERIYYGINRYVVEVSEKQGSQGYGSFIGRFAYGADGQEALMSEFKERDKTTDNGKDAKVEQLKPFGIGALETVFRIVKSDGKHLVLESDYARLELSRF